ncbi:MAG TPA: helix-turn-helix transcriptional regulator [Saliniramus sp.]|nr:helix-turn-helix transcriptional regulator [Saliniramus sp.]
MSLSKTFGANLRHRRKDARLTQVVLAERVSLSIDMLSRLERGEASPSFKTIKTLAEALDIPPEAFFHSSLEANLPGPRGRLLNQVNVQLSRMSDDTIAQAIKLLTALR